MNPPLYLALIHGPVRNKRGAQITTSVTNLDIHDISRSCRTFGVKNYFIVTPIKAQHELVNKILGHWREDKNNEYNPDRSDALSSTFLKNTLEDAINAVREKEDVDPLVCVTGANFEEFDGKEDKLIQQARVDKKPILLIFGTGWGLTALMCESADFRLEPIYSQAIDEYNHLSVRSAVAIYLDRITKASKTEE